MFEFTTEREKYIWIAAWIDTEGSINLHRQRGAEYSFGFGWRPSISIGNTNEGVLITLAYLIGKGNIRLKKRATALLTHKPMYELYISPNQCRELLPLIRPFLVLKHRQADLLLEALEIIRSNVHLTGGAGEVRERNHRLLEENFAKLENIHQNLTTLNMRGNG